MYYLLCTTFRSLVIRHNNACTDDQNNLIFSSTDTNEANLYACMHNHIVTVLSAVQSFLPGATVPDNAATMIENMLKT